MRCQAYVPARRWSSIGEGHLPRLLEIPAMRTRRFALLAALALLALPSSALAQSAGDDQYTNPLPQTQAPSPSGSPSGSNSGSGGGGSGSTSPGTGSGTGAN